MTYTLSLPTDSTLAEFMVAGGIAHPDMFCTTRPSGEWVTVPTGTLPADTTLCPECGWVADTTAVHPLLSSPSFTGVTVSMDTPERGTSTGSGRSVPVAGATDKQKAFVARLLAECDTTLDALGGACTGATVDTLTKAAASAAIDKLMGIKSTAPTATAPTAVRPNKFAGKCTGCGNTVAEGAGTIAKVDGRWTVAHLAGECPTATTEVVAPKVTVPTGRYAYTGGEGHTVFVKVDAPTEGKWAGYVFVRLLTGGGAGGTLNEGRVSKATGDAMVAAIAAQGVEASGLRFGQESGVCCRCGRGLTNEASREAGIGPECATKGWD